MYGVMKEESGYSYRAMVLIDKEGVVIFRTVSDLPIGCGITEALRLVKGTRPVGTANADGNDIKAARNVKNNIDRTGGEETKSSTSTTSIIKAKSVGDGADQVQKEAKSNSKPDDKNKNVDEKLSGPEMCDCSLGYPHSINLHADSRIVV